VTSSDGVTGPEGIRLESLAKHYTTPAGVVRAVDGITLDVEPGTSLAITGPSGCGKSTLLGLIGGLEAPTAGRVVIGGRQVSTMSDRERARLRRAQVGFVFQFDNLLPFLTAVENVGLQLALSAAPERAERSIEYERCTELLVELGLAGQLDQLPDQLSGGQRQRVAVARALIHRPRVILADEPTGELDPVNAGAVLDLLLGAPREPGSTLVVVTHDPAVARRLDRTLSLRDGRSVGDTAGGSDEDRGA
jgi:putative ABC transport system ATP-binding protein